ncbi:MAG TPA: serine hydrolase [Thermoanaerobaculia bacterium]|nr:serine hydrolase [Thermoanaerobaculia bacterium]
MRWLVSLLLLSFGTPLRAAELPPLGDQASTWAASLGRGAVATAEKRDGRWTFAIAGQPFAAGHAEVPADRVLFEIGSISKVFTGILLADAVRAGKLGLDDPLSRHLPSKFGDPATGAVTLKQLATHTSCLPRLPDNLMHASSDDPYAQYDNKAMFDYLARAKLEGKPPCEATYSNLGFGILGVVLETAYGKPWSTLVQEKIAGPLGMVDTVQDLSPAQQSRFAEPWDGEKRAQPWTFKAVAGAGGLRSSLADLSKLADALLAGSKGPLGDIWPLLAGDYADLSAVGGKVGLGLLHAKDSGEDSYYHEGGTGGFRSVISVRPASGRAVVVLASNASAPPLAWLAAWEAAGRLPVTRSEVALPAEVLDEYVGVYSIDKSSRFTLLRRGDGLVARLTGQPFVPVFASAKDELFYKVVDAQLSLRRGASGTIEGLTLHQNGREIPASRDPGPPPRIEFPDAAALEQYVGEYDFGQFQPDSTITVKAAAETLVVMLTGQPALPVFCVGKDRFEYDVVEAALTFERDTAGKVVAVVLHQNGLEMRAPRR